MNLHEASEIRELTSDEMDHVSGGFGALWNVTWMGGFFDVRCNLRGFGGGGLVS
jgi:hypothetical protein